MANVTLTYREVIPDFSNQEEWTEITLNTGGTQSTLQDIKVIEKAGGYCYRNVELNHTRNRFIYWRYHQDVLELSEISLDFNLYQNNVRIKFTDSPVIGVSITEQGRSVVLLVSTVCSLHRLTFPHPDVLVDAASSFNSKDGSSYSTAGSTASGAGCPNLDYYNDSQSSSIFRDANMITTNSELNMFYVIDNHHIGTTNPPIPHVATNYLSPDGLAAYFAFACQCQLMLYVMDSKGQTSMFQLKEHHLMPRLFSNLKDALTGKKDASDAHHASSLAFNHIDNQTYLLVLYRNDQLRMWSANTQNCVCSISCVRDNQAQRLQGPQSNALRKINDTSFCVFLSHANGSEFVCIDLIQDSENMNGYNLVHRKVIAAPQLELTDFNVSESRIWALWSNANGEFSISNFSLLRGMGLNWISAAMEPPPDRSCINTEPGVDARDAYCSYIFHPGKFDKDVITKALMMFRRSGHIRFDSKHCYSMAKLKQHVCQVIENELKNEIKDYELTDEYCIDIASSLWHQFYTSCEQYYMKACEPKGLLILEPLDGICVIKKNNFSLLRPCEPMEHLMLTGDDADLNVIIPMHFADDRSLGEDLVNLIGLIAQIEKWLPDDVKLDLDKKLYQLEMPSSLVAELVEDILSGDPEKDIFPNNFLVIIRQRLQTISDIIAVMEFLMANLRMDFGNPEAMQTHLNLGKHSKFLFSIGTLFGSQIGISVLSDTVRQTAHIRFSICRNLLILQQILNETSSLAAKSTELFRSQFMPDLYIFLQSYFVMVWISDVPVNLNNLATLETSRQRLSLAHLINDYGRITFSNGKAMSAPLLRVFLHSKGLYTALSLFTENFKEDNNFVTWQSTLMSLNTIVSQLIWPVSYNFVFGEWLFGTCQHNIIEDYVRFLNNWCEWNVCSRQFILAVSLLDCCENQKAYTLFLQSSKGILKEQFLSEKILRNPAIHEIDKDTDMETDDEGAKIRSQAIAQYFLKVIELFEQRNIMDKIISIAQVAISMLDKNDNQLPMFQSIVFNNHLQLEHYDEAYHSLIYNADKTRSKDCLRQLVVTLFNKKKLDLLMHFPYVGLYEEFENIVESRARSMSIEDNTIYDFLYAFYVNNGNLRKASTAMYEKAMRLGTESDSLESMQKRCDALRVCLNVMFMVDERYRWIAKPIIPGDELTTNLNVLKYGSHNDMETTDNTLNGLTKYKQVVVLETKDIQCELLQSESLVLLAQHRKDAQTFFNADPVELSIILASAGLFTAALRLANGFQISLLPIFDSLTAACIRTADENANEAWSWLHENDLADLPHKYKAADMAWSLLQKLIKENEEKDSTRIRKSVVNKILSLNAFVPQWLYNDYQSSNCSELLNLFVKHNRLLEAAELAEQMLKAMLGSGSEYFSFKYPISITNPEMCLPVNTIDLLLHGLNLNSNGDIEYKQSFVGLEELLRLYVTTSLSTAEDKVQMKLQIQRAQEQIRL